MSFTGGHFTLRAADQPQSWFVEWSGVVASAKPQACRLLDESDQPLDLEAIWDDCAAAQDLDLKRFGLAFWRLLIDNAAGSEWQKARQNFDNTAGVWRTGLKIEDEALEALPWELLWDREFDTAAWASPSQTFCRIDSLGPPKSNLIDDWPWRVLVLQGAGGAGIQVDAEVEAIYRAWWPMRHEVVIRRLPADIMPGDLPARIREIRPHILHFTGHAIPGALKFEKFDWSDISGCFDKGTHPLPRLVWLNACQTATQKIQPAEQSNARARLRLAQRSVAQAFRKLGTPWVVGARGDIDGELATFQAEQFYGFLAGGQPIDVALARSRSAAKGERENIELRRKDGGISKHQPYLVSAIGSADPAQLQLLEKADPKVSAAVLKVPIFKKLGQSFVDRNSTRSALFDGALNQCARLTTSRFTAFHGLPRSGKSWVLHSVLQALSLRGWIVRCHAMNGLESERFWLQALKLFRDGAPTSAGKPGSNELIAPLPAKPFQAFDEAVNALPAVDSEDSFKKIFGAFLAGLEGCEQPVVIALDQIKAHSHWLDLWKEYLFDVVSEGRKSPVLVLTSMETAVFEAAEFEKSQGIPVGLVGSDEIEMAVQLYFRQALGEFWSSDEIQSVLRVAIPQYCKKAKEKGLDVTALPTESTVIINMLRVITELKIPVPEP